MARCATHKTSKSASGWRRPSSGQRRRRALEKRCPGAFASKKGGKLHFPVMAERGRCCVDCRGARVAYQRASQWKRRYPGVAAKIKAQAARTGCAWAR